MRRHSGLQTHLYIVQDLPEDGALFPPVVLGSVLVAVCGQTLQTVTQALAVLHLELLQKRASSLKWTSHNTAVSLLRLHLSDDFTSSTSRPSSTSKAMVSPTAIR